MTRSELDRLLDGSEGLTLETTDGVKLRFDRHALEYPPAFRAVMRRAFGHEGYQAPVYNQEDHDTIVRVMFRIAEADGDA